MKHMDCRQDPRLEIRLVERLVDAARLVRNSNIPDADMVVLNAVLMPFDTFDENDDDTDGIARYGHGCPTCSVATDEYTVDRDGISHEECDEDLMEALP